MADVIGNVASANEFLNKVAQLAYVGGYSALRLRWDADDRDPVGHWAVLCRRGSLWFVQGSGEYLESALARARSHLGKRFALRLRQAKYPGVSGKRGRK